MQRNIAFLGIPIVKVKKTDTCEKRYFFGIQYKVKKYARRYDDFADLFAEKCSELRGKNVKVVMNNLGEVVIYARTARFWYKDGMCVFARKPAQIDIFKMFSPELPVFYCGEADLHKEAVVNECSLSAILTDEQTIALNNTGLHFYKNWEKHLNADFSQMRFSQAVVSEEAKRSALAKAKLFDIDLDNFVLLIPNATSQDPLPIEFWQDITRELNAKGIGVFRNSKLFSVEEFYVLASRAKAIIANRCGLCDVLCELPVPQYVIYGHNPHHEDLQPMYTFAGFPWAAHDFITEYNTHKQTLETIKADILKGIVSGKR